MYRSMKRGVGAERILGPKLSLLAAMAASLARPLEAPYCARVKRVGCGTSRMVASVSTSLVSSSSTDGGSSGRRCAASAAVSTSYRWRWNSHQSLPLMPARWSGIRFALPLCGNGLKQTWHPARTLVAGAYSCRSRKSIDQRHIR